jgi:CRISPR-associated protein Cas5t
VQVVRVEMEGITTSFRYPHFMWGRHPTFEMPPPATIYGHICSAVGEWVDPAGVSFGYTFTHEGKGEDLEHVHAVSAGTGKSLREKGRGVVFAEPVNTQGNVNPLTREFLFRPRMTLYVSPTEYTEFFKSPYYSTILGRSQDLMSYRSVKAIELERASQAYYEHTILPWEMQVRTRRGITILMPRYVDYSRGREPAFERYVLLQSRVVLRPTDESQEDLMEEERPVIRYEGESMEHWVDPDSPEHKGAKRGVWMHRFTE